MKQVMTGLEIVNVLYGIKDDLLPDTSHRTIIFKNTLSMMDGRHQNKGYKQEFMIGLSELTENPSAMYSIGEAMVPIVTLFHEVSGHGGQERLEFTRNTSLSKVLALNHYACQGSKYYYEGFGPFKSDQYWKQPYEIAAQYAGIKGAYCYLSRKWGQENATEAICAYETFRQDNQCAFLGNHKTYTDVDSILNDLNKKFQKCIYAKRDYDFNEAKQFPHDSLRRFAAFKQDYSYISRIENCRNGLKSDWMMASAYVWCRDYKYEIRSKPVFKDVSLDPDIAFQKREQPIRPKPKTKELDLNQLSLEDALKELETSQSHLQL